MGNFEKLRCSLFPCWHIVTRPKTDWSPTINHSFKLTFLTAADQTTILRAADGRFRDIPSSDVCFFQYVVFNEWGDFVELSGFVSVAGAGAGFVMPRSSLGRWLPWLGASVKL